VKLAAQEGMVPGASLLEKMEALAQFGYEGMEFGGHNLPGREKEIARAAERSGIKVASICAGYPGCLLSPDPAVRQQAVDGIKTLLAAGGQIGCVDGLIMVPIFGGPQLPDLSPMTTARELEHHLIVKLLEELAPTAESAQCNILVEPLNRYETHFLNRLEQGVAVVAEVNHPRVKIMADFFHMNIEEPDIGASIRAAGKHVAHIHLADSTRMLPGHGHTDFASGFAALKEIGYQGYMAMECGVPGDPAVELPKSAQYLKQWI
jgi:sugar phosphate isomerase/epimerase